VQRCHAGAYSGYSPGTHQKALADGCRSRSCSAGR
jgi:hypothetical protein